jgi:predicted MPP superfamily phosphohydrolase
MLPGTLPFNLLLAAVILAAWFLGRDRPRLVLLIAGASGLLLAVVVGGGGFGTMRLLAWGLFAHGPLLLLALGWRLRRQGKRFSASAAALGAVALLLVAVQAFLVEPRQLEVTTHRLAVRGITAPLRVALVADIQTDQVGDYERQALATLAASKPDLVLLAGDYVQVADPEVRTRQRRALRRAWRAAGIAPPLGTIAVQGNSDPAGWEEAFAGLPVAAASRTRRYRRGEVTVTALSYPDSFDTALRVQPARGLHIVLGHGPDFALADPPAQLLLAGHVHGGQVRLPFFGPLITFSALPREQAVGRTDLPGGRTLVVSRGVGMERATAPRLRFLCRPEIVLLDLVPAQPREHAEDRPGRKAARQEP